MKTPRLALAAVAAAALGTSFVAYAALGGASGVRIPYSGVLEQDGVLLSGQVDLTFGVWNVESGGAAPCYSSGPIATTVSSGRFAVVIGPVTQSCVANRDVWLDVAVDTGNGPTTLPGRQRIYPAVAATSSGTGDFDVGGNLSVTGTTQVGVMTASDLTVSGVAHLGVYMKSCYYNDPGLSHDSCACNGNDQVINGGPDCDYGGREMAVLYSHPLSRGAWYALCEEVGLSGSQRVDPVEIRITCARIN